MPDFNLALLQLDSGTDLEYNLQKGLDACRSAKAMGADMALFPEMWSCGYTIPEDMDALHALAIPAGHPDCNGHSAAYDGVAYVPDLPGSRDTCIVEAGGEEGVYMASFDMDMIRDYRRSEVHGNAFRRPTLYAVLIDEAVQAPFIRKEARR